MKHAIKKTAIIAALSTLSFGAAAQSFIEVESVPSIIGLGVGFAPDYRGSDDYTGAVAPFGRYTFANSNRYVQLNANELTLNVLNSSAIRFGPVVNYVFGRDDDVDDPRVKQMAKIDGTVEVGVFGELAWIDRGNPRNRFLAGVTLLKDTGGESDGFRARFSARYFKQVSQAIDFHLGGGIWYADGKWTQTYFGVNPQNVGTSGLPFYNAGSNGVNEYFMTVGGIMYFSRNWLGAAGLRISQLAGDAKDSPIVAQQGDKTQFIGGIGVAYMFR